MILCAAKVAASNARDPCQRIALPHRLPSIAAYGQLLRRCVGAMRNPLVFASSIPIDPFCRFSRNYSNEARIRAANRSTSALKGRESMKFTSGLVALLAAGLFACGADPCSKSSPCPNDTPATLAQRDQCRANNSAHINSPCYVEAVTALNCESDNVVCGATGRTDPTLTSIRVQNTCRVQVSNLLACCVRNPTSSVCSSSDMRPPPAVDAGTATPDSGTPAPIDAGVRPDSSADARAMSNDATADARPPITPAGGACDNNAMCGALTCDTSIRGGTCTGNCSNDANQANERAQCGGTSSTCLAIGDGPTAQTECAAACNPSSPSACRAGFVCTGFWYSHAGATPDSAGCHPFCTSNEHCPAGQTCNVRTGSCGAAAHNPSLLADGMPCTLPAEGAPSPCRGACFRIGSNGTTGICGSVVNMATQRSCPDDPTLIEPLYRLDMDNLGLCLFRSCSASRCCPNGLVCEGASTADRTGLCGLDEPSMPNIACTP